jgi:hypothetical protein
VGIFLPAYDELFIYGVTSKVTIDCLIDWLVEWGEDSAIAVRQHHHFGDQSR